MNAHLHDPSGPVHSPASWGDHFDGDDPNWAVAATDGGVRHVARPVEHVSSSSQPNDKDATRPTGPFVPLEPQSLRETGLRPALIESLILKYLLTAGQASGREIAQQLALAFRWIAPLLDRMKNEQLLSRESATPLGDFSYALTPNGTERARRYSQQNTYCGAAPVNVDEYVRSVGLQSVRLEKPSLERIRTAFRELVIGETQLIQIGEALNMGKGFFVYGAPGNGKTSIAQYAISAYSSSIWIPRALHLNGEIVRLYDPTLHQLAPQEPADPATDARWVKIQRPMLLVGGDLQLEHLDVTANPSTRINEAPIHLKCNGGVLVFDDFGRYKFPIDALLNRLIVPLERRTDCLHLASGRPFEVPFDLLVVFSTNLRPQDIVDEAFLRRIPYKFKVESPTEDQFSLVFLTEAQRSHLACTREAVEYLLDSYYRNGRYAMRFSHPRDLIRHIRNACEFRQLPWQVTPQLIDAAVSTCLGHELPQNA